VLLSAEQAHYLRNVMRLAPGAHVRLFNGRHGEWRAELADIGKKGANAMVGERTRPHRDDPDLWLLFAPIKRARIDFIAEKASELGVAAMQPVFTRYTDASRVNVGRLRVHAVEAAEQCARVTVPAVFDAERLDRVLDRWPAGRRLMFCDEKSTDIGIADVLGGIRREQAGPDPGPWAVLIGPEGGFAPDEAQRLRAMPQTVAVGLGERLLRADTAAVAALSCWQAILGDWR